MSTFPNSPLPARLLISLLHTEGLYGCVSQGVRFRDVPEAIQDQWREAQRLTDELATLQATLLQRLTFGT